MASTFPTRLDVIPLFLDITQADSANLNNYQDAIRNGNFTSALQYLNLIANANQKIIKAERLNKLRDCILAVEDFYLNDIQSYITTKQSAWTNRINQFSYIGSFSSSITYDRDNMVSYTTSDGVTKMYKANVDSVPRGTLPTNTNYWQVITIQGARGETTTSQTIFGYDWDSAFPYTENYIVIYGTSWWISTQSNTNQTPQSGSQYWTEILNFSPMIYPMQSTQPTNQTTGEFWFRLL